MAFDGSIISTATTASFVGFTYSDTFSIISTGDVDMVAITLSAGRKYTIDIDNGAAGDLYLRVFDAFGSEVRANDDGFRAADDVVFSLSPYVQFTPNYTGTYYVAASTYFLQGYDPFTTFGRSLVVENPIGIINGTLTISDEGSNNWPVDGSINAITLESTSDETDALRDEGRSHRVQYIGNLDDGLDVDMAKMDLFKGDVVVVDVNGLTNNGTTIRVFNAAGTQIGIDDLAGFASDPELVFGAPSAGAYYVGISGDGNTTYNAVDGTGQVASAFTGDFEVIVHLNPTMIGTNTFQQLNGAAESDYIVALAGNDTVNGNDGNDTLAGGDEQDSMNGGNGNDVLYGEQGNDTLLGFTGNDVLVGGIGHDTLNGGGGVDVLEGGAGNDTLNGGGGVLADTLSGGSGDDVLLGFSGNDQLRGEEGNDSLDAGNNDDFLFGGNGSDTLNGGSGADLLDGGGDNDTLLGFRDNDFLVGGGGNDSLDGGTFDDTLFGAEGNDSLLGGAGIDVFAFNSTGPSFGVDLIQDFVVGTDDIDLAFIFSTAGSVVNAGNLAQFVQTSTAGVVDSFLGVDANGITGGLNFVIIAQVANVSAAQLFDFNNFLV